MAAKWFTECEHSAFISYSFDDDIIYNRFVTSFNNELNITLPTQLRGIKVPAAHLSTVNGAKAGILDEKLRASIENSFAMIIFVHKNYTESDWCLKELEYFKNIFGDDGFRERLFIIAMSEDYMNTLRDSAEWRRLTDGKDLISIPFFQEQKRNRPVDIYNEYVKGVATTAFWNPFLDFIEDLGAKIKSNIEMQRKTIKALNDNFRDHTTLSHTATRQNGVVRIFIESNQNEVDHWESLGEQTVKSWEQVIKAFPPPQLYIRPSRLPIDNIDEYWNLNDADGVILLWGHKTRDSLAAQIRKVEDILPGPDLAPCIVAYLMPPQEISDKPVISYGWPVVRFIAPEGGVITVFPPDSPKLEHFLEKALSHRTKAQRRDQ